MNEAFVVRNAVKLTCKGSHVVVHAAEKKAAEIGVPACIAVVDEGGGLLAFSRTDGVGSGSVAIAITKAVSAATRRKPTAEEGGGDPIQGMIRALAGVQVTGLPGGVPIVVDGFVVGAVGVSGGTTEQDLAVARAGIDALLTG